MQSKVKITIRPDGRCAVNWTPSVRSCQSCQTSSEVETGTMQENRAISPSKGQRLGNSRKTEMSWKTGRQVTWRMGAMEQHFGISNSLFITGTLPTVSRRGFRALAENSSVAIDRLNVFISREFGDVKFARVSVWEYQKRGALHWHMALSSEAISKMNLKKFRYLLARKWYDILKRIGEKEGVKMTRGSHGKDRDFNELMSINNGEHFLNLQVVKKSIVSYLSAYLVQSQQGKDKKGKQKLRRKFWPIKTWAQWNRYATELMKMYTQEVVLGETHYVNSMFIGMSARAAIENIDTVEGTGIKTPKNRYVKGLYFIAEKSGKNWDLKLIEEMMFQFNWLEKSNEIKRVDELKISDGKDLIADDEFIEDDEEIEEEMIMRYANLEMKKLRRKESNKVKEINAKTVIWAGHFGVNMLKLMREVEVNNASITKENYAQMELELWKRKDRKSQ